MINRISPHVFRRSGYDCAHCPLPKTNTRVHIDPDSLPETVDITEPARRPEELATPRQLALPKPRSPKAGRRRVRS